MLKNITIQHFKALRDVRIEGLGRLNAFIGRNNAGKSSVLHVLDLAGLAIRHNNWKRFPLKLKIEDLFWRHEDFALTLESDAHQTVKISAKNREQPIVDSGDSPREQFESILILPDPTHNLLRRQVVSPQDVMNRIENRDFTEINALDILRAVKYYSKRQERGFTEDDYNELIDEVLDFFPELEEIVTDHTEQLHATLEYKEHGQFLDILYSGSGLKRFLDILIKVKLSQASLVLLDEPEFAMHPELQRRFSTFLERFAELKDLQFFMATHSPVFLNASDRVEVYRVLNQGGERTIVHVPSISRHTVLGDLGIKPSDLFQNDLCVMVEGQDDIVFFDYVLHELYGDEFSGVAVAVVQFGGKGSIENLVNDRLDIRNVTAFQSYVHWVFDRDAKPTEDPDNHTQKLIEIVRSAGQAATLLSKREIEYYVPMEVYLDAQGNNSEKQETVRKLFDSDQPQKFRSAMSGCHIPRGTELRSLLQTHLKKENLHQDIKQIVEDGLLPWAQEIRGDDAVA